MIIFLYGADSYRSRRKLNEIVANFRAREDKSGMNTASLDAAKSSIGEIQQALFAPAFLGSKRLVAVNGLLALKADAQEPFAELVGKLPESTTAVFFETEEIKKLEKSPLYPLLTAGKFHWEFAPLNPAQMAGFIASEAKALSADFDPPALAALAEAVGSDSARAANELAKLASYAGPGGKIGLAAVSALVSSDVAEDAFGFLDAVAEKKPALAAKKLEEQMEAGSEPMQVLAMIARSVRLMIQAKDMLERGVPQNEAVKELGIHPFAARKALTQARNFETKTLRSLHAALLDADRRIKTGNIASSRLALDLIVARMVG